VGYYIETPSAKGKADWLLKEHSEAFEISEPLWEDLNAWFVAGYALVMVVENEPFDAAVYVFNENEFDHFTDPADTRKARFILMGRDLVEDLSGYKRTHL
jgi:hypothetical protein